VRAIEHEKARGTHPLQFINPPLWHSVGRHEQSYNEEAWFSVSHRIAYADYLHTSQNTDPRVRVAGICLDCLPRQSELPSASNLCFSSLPQVFTRLRLSAPALSSARCYYWLSRWYRDVQDFTTLYN